MTGKELESWLEKHEYIEWKDVEDKKVMLFRNVNLPYYYKNPENSTQITYEKLQTMSGDELLGHINQGLQVEQMTRVTGYMSKVGSWNKGKLGELKDRERHSIGQPTYYQK